MIIEEDFGNDYYGNLVIHNYPNLQSIVVKKCSLKNLNSLKICNCEKLKTIKMENGKEWEENAFYNVRKTIIESINDITILFSCLPNLQSFKIGYRMFENSSSFSISSNYFQI